MRKIPTVFVRDPETKLRYVLNEVVPGCEWVLAGEGVATRKYDGTCCLVRDGKLYKRHEVKPGKQAPPDFEAIETDENTGKTVGWVPVGDGPDDKWHREAWEADLPESMAPGTYELCGPKVQGDPERFGEHVLVSHDYAEVASDAPRDFDGLRVWLLAHEWEGHRLAPPGRPNGEAQATGLPDHRRADEHAAGARAQRGMKDNPNPQEPNP